MRTYEIDFKALKAQIPIEQVLAMLNVNNLKREGKELRGQCPICGSKGSHKPAFCVTPHLNAFTCFGECKNKGDIIELTACVKRISKYAAAKILDQQFNNNGPFHSSPAPAPAKADNGIDQGTKYATSLDPAHPKLEPLGISPEVFKAWRAGVQHGSGVLAGMLALPVTRDGITVAYIGRSIDEEEVRIKFPKTEFGKANQFCAEDYIFGEDRVTEKTLVVVSDPLDVVTHENDGTSFVCFINEKSRAPITIKQLKNLVDLMEQNECETLMILA